MKLSSIINSFKDLNILVVGDIMLDSYQWGRSSRISPEAPVPVVDIQGSEDRLGGAANVALNLVQLGASVSLYSVSGNDELRPVLLDLLKDSSIPSENIIPDNGRMTTRKTRIISHGKHIVRFDHESRKDITSEIEDILLDKIQEHCKSVRPDAIILQDYNKGLFTERVIKSIVQLANEQKIFIAVDPKRDRFFNFKGVDLFKPNLKEVKDALQSEIDPENEESLSASCSKLMDKIHCKNILLTLSKHGMYYFDSEGKNGQITAHHRNIIDVSGAGDTVISVATAAMAVEPDIAKASLLSNLAGGLVCEKVGVVPISNSELMDAMKKDNLEEIRMTY
ncbi:MAG: hypothetical protein HKN92_01475 [Chitinophagales bacterium]|nr:hypothetical protein [Chitinophagales bacterium]